MERITYLVANYDKGEYIAACLASLREQSDERWLCLIADDHSSDDSVERIGPFLDSQIRLLRHEKNRGYIETLIELIEHATTDIVAILDPDDALDRDATAALLQRYAEDPRTGFVYSKFEVFDRDFDRPIDVRGEAIPPAATSLFAGHIGHVRSFRISSYRRTLGLDPGMLYAEDRDLVYKLEEVTRPSFIDRALYKHRRVPGSQSTDPVKKEVGLRSHLRAQHDAMKRREIRGFSSALHRFHFFALYLTRSDRCPHILNGPIAALSRLVDRCDRWLRLRTRGRLRRPGSDKRVCYYLWRYPVLSETFVQREIAALAGTGAQIVVLADSPADTTSAVHAVQYLFPLKKRRLLKYAARFALRNPWMLVRTLVEVLSSAYVRSTRLSDDLRVFVKAVYLAGMLEDMGAEHGHSPWAAENAFVLRCATRLAGLPFSVQARAQDIFRDHYRHGLQHRIGAAQFIVTNSEFSRRHLLSTLEPENQPEIHMIYEGLDLEEFPENTVALVSQTPRPLRVLCVSRLIECKGLLGLLEACHRLRRSGLAIECTIIGGPEEPQYSDYYRRFLEKRRDLDLESFVLIPGERPFPEVLEAYRNADLFVLPCTIGSDGTRDITPNVLMEAMAVGLPVISTEMTAIPEIVEHRVSGLLVPPDDTSALVAAITELHGDSALRQRLGAAGRRRVEERFDIRTNIQAYAALLARDAESFERT